METLRTLLSDNEKQWIEMHPIRVSGCRIYIKITNTHTHNTTRLPLQYWLKHTLLPSSTKHDLLAWSLFNKVQKRSVWAWWMFGPRSYQSSSHWYEVTIWMQEPRGTINKKCGAYSGQRAGHWLAAGAHHLSLHQSPVLLETSVVESSPVIWYNAVTCIFHVKSNMMHWQTDIE